MSFADSLVNYLLDAIYQDRRRRIVQWHSLYWDRQQEFSRRFSCPLY